MKVAVPGVPETVPVIAPVEEFRVAQEGSDPLATVQLLALQFACDAVWL